MYQQEHDVLFAAIRKDQPINDGKRMATSTMLAIMGRMAAYTGQQITWDQAMNSQEKLVPETSTGTASWKCAVARGARHHKADLRHETMHLDWHCADAAADPRLWRRPCPDCRDPEAAEQARERPKEFTTAIAGSARLRQARAVQGHDPEYHGRV